MTHDPRDELWNAIFETLYDAYYNEIVADKLIGRWQLLDESTKLLVAITASGSAIAGWTLWAKPGFQSLWVCVAGAAAFLSISHAALSVADRLKDAGEIKRTFASLRIDLETCRHRMRINPEYSVEEFTQQLEEYRRRFGDSEQRIKNDILRTTRLKNRAQTELNRRLESESVLASS